jgi:hypothetical protein
MSGSNNVIHDAATYVCSHQIGGILNAFGSGPARVPRRPWPLTFVEPTPALCTYTVATGDWNLNSPGSWWYTPTSVLNPGIYCHLDPEGKLSLSGANITHVGAGVTFFSRGKIEISGDNYNLNPFFNGVLMHSTSEEGAAIKTIAVGGSWAGILYARDGRIDFSGNPDFALQGSLIGDRVKAGGSSWSLAADANLGGTGYAQLID